MNKLYIDFETYYDKSYSLSMMPTQAYIAHPNFQVIGVGYIYADEKGQSISSGWLEEPGVLEILDNIDKENTTVVAHNCAFDGLILYHHYGFIAANYACTASMARYTGLSRIPDSAALGSLLTYLQSKGVVNYKKGDAVVHALGKTRAMMSDSEWKAYGEYCLTDVRGSRDIYELLHPYMTEDEFVWQDMVLRCAVNPCLCLDTFKLRKFIADTREAHAKKVAELAVTLGVSDITELGASLRSDAKFKELLEGMGVEVENKIGPSGKEKPAFAKTDQFMKDLSDHPNPDVQSLVATRIGEKGLGSLNRAIRLTTCPSNSFGAPYIISGAHTHRLSGADKINMQNLDSGRVKGKAATLRECILPPPGHKIWAADSSQIEARLLSFCAGDTEMLRVFETGGDPYAFQASQLFHRPVEEISAGHKAGEREYVLMRSIGKSLVLGAGYGIGPDKFYAFAKQSGVAITLANAREYIALYRASRHKVVELWRTAQDCFSETLSSGKETFFSTVPKVSFAAKVLFGTPCIVLNLPNGSYLTYPSPARSANEGLTYTTGKRTGRLYGGVLVENLIQSLSFAQLKWQASLLEYPLVMNVHDEHVIVARAGIPDEVVEGHLRKCMTSVPVWLRGFPCDCSIGKGDNYGAC